MLACSSDDAAANGSQPGSGSVELLVAASDYSSSRVCAAPGACKEGTDLGKDPMLAETNGRAFFLARDNDLLFELDPALRALFHGDMADQGRKLMQMLGMAVNGLERLEVLAPAVRQLGMRHANYHVRDEHYDTVGEALLWTLGKGLGPDFTAEMQAAWARTYWLLAETMKAGARDALAMQTRAAVA
jgi:hemoglobin-like flavoprotein